MRDVEGLKIGILFAAEFELDVVVVGVGELTFVGFALERGYCQVAADIFLVLAFQLQRGVKAGRGNVELEILLVAVEAVLDGTAELDAVVDCDAVVAVDSHIDAVVGRYLEVDKVFFAAREGCVDNVEYVKFVNHVIRFFQ